MGDATDKSTRKWWILGAMGGVLAAVVLDETAVGVALPTIGRDLGMSPVATHWVVNAYLLTLTGLAAAAGKALDLVGMKRLVLIGLAIFGISSATCGLAPDGAVLIAARSMQGVGAAIIFPACVVMITAVFPAEQRGFAFGIQVTIGAVFLSSGPFIGGVLTEWVSWRAVFWINIPIILLVATVVMTLWRDPPRPQRPERLDVVGAALFLAGVFAMVLAVMQGNDWGWSSATIIVLFASGLTALFLFALHELHVRDPLIQVRLLRNSTFAVSNVQVFTAQFGKIAITVLGATWLQHRVGLTPTQAGVVLLAAIAPTLVTSLASGRMADRFGPRRPILLGAVCSATGLAWIAVASTTNQVGPMLPGLLLWGTALPFLNVPPRHAAMNSVEPAEHGQAGGINLSAQLLGGTVGMAVGSALLATTDDFRIVFAVPAVLTVVTLVMTWFMMNRGAARAVA